MRQVGRVVEINKEYATVEVMRSSACDGCHKNSEGGCVACNLFSLDNTVRTKAKNSISASLGDRVVLESGTGRMLSYTALLFLLPLVTAALAYAAAGLFALAEIWLIASAAAGFLVPLMIIAFVLNRLASSRCDTEIVDFEVRDAGANFKVD